MQGSWYETYKKHSHLIKQLIGKYPTPFIILDSERVIEKYNTLRANLEDVDVYYSVKAQDNPEIIKRLAMVGSGFEIASESELKAVIKHVQPHKVITSNPFKNDKFLKKLIRSGVKLVVIDSYSELIRIARYKFDFHIYIRIKVTDNSKWMLNNKFGCELNDVRNLAKMAKILKLKIVGVSFHVGSQNLTPEAYEEAFDKALKALDILSSFFPVYYLNIGGGLPVEYTDPIPDINLYFEQIRRGIQKVKTKYPDIIVHIEPGRYLVADAGVMVSKVLGVANRGQNMFVYIDAGLFTGLVEGLGGMKYSYILLRNDDVSTYDTSYVLAGPTCDGMDIVDRHVMLPSNIWIDDYIIIAPAGAYTNVYATNFNGFPKPKVYVV